jgi:hypothetical protein
MYSVIGHCICTLAKVCFRNRSRVSLASQYTVKNKLDFLLQNFGLM